MDHALRVQGSGVGQNLFDHGQPAGCPGSSSGTKQTGGVNAPRHFRLSCLGADTNAHQCTRGLKNAGGPAGFKGGRPNEGRPRLRQARHPT